MSDFFQNGVITTLHALGPRPLEELEEELASFSRRRPMALVLPSLYSELEGEALPRIVEVLADASYISEIVIGLDRADRRQFDHARQFFSRLPQEHHILWQDGPGMAELDVWLGEQALAPGQRGKGRNAWYCLGFVLARERARAVALHDCDILTYERDLPARLFYPVANPTFDYWFSKGYYPRLTDTGFGGRVTRLFLTPLLRSLLRILGPLQYLLYLDSFRYPLAGEFAMHVEFARTVRIPADWGLEIGLLSEAYRNLALNQVCQVEIADRYDHKHQPVSTEDRQRGLNRMTLEIAKAIYRKLATEGVTLTKELFRTIKATYFRMALDMLKQHHDDARFNGYTLDRHAEERLVEFFAQNVIVASEEFMASPMEVPFIPNWNRVNSALPEFSGRLLDVVAADNG